MTTRNKKARDDKTMLQIKRLRKENKALKVTCEILADQKAMEDIKDSLNQIKRGKGIPLSKLENV